MTGERPECGAPPVRPPLWWRTSVGAGAGLQLVATAFGGLGVAVATGAFGGPTWLRALALAVGLVLVYLDTHAVAHFAVGRAVGIHFRGFGLRGTDHPESYSPGVRQLMGHVPMWVALTDPSSRRAASPPARAAMYAAGETSTTLCTLAAAAAALLGGAPGGVLALLVSAAWTVVASVVVAVIPKGDYAKAARALRSEDRAAWAAERRRPTATAPIDAEPSASQ